MITELVLAAGLVYALIAWGFTGFATYQLVPQNKIKALTCSLIGFVWPAVVALVIFYYVRWNVWGDAPRSFKPKPLVTREKTTPYPSPASEGPVHDEPRPSPPGHECRVGTGSCLNCSCPCHHD